jgi:hypothetical protein
VPQTLDNSYTINIADGTYAEPINTAGFIGTGLTYGTVLTLLGNIGTPSNVQFTGTLMCSPWAVGACINGSAHVLLSVLEINATARDGIACFSGVVELSNVVVTGILNVGMEAERCDYVFDNSVTTSGVVAASSPSDGMCLYAARGSIGGQNSGTWTCTGPGGAGTVGLGMVFEFGSVFATGGNNVISITGVQYGILINNNGAFVSYGPTTVISIVNVSTPSLSQGINTSSGGSYDATANTLTVTHFTNCIQAAGNSVMASGGTQNLNNCGTNTNAIQGSQIILF